MNKVTNDYAPDLARHKLMLRFESNEPMLEKLRTIKKTSVCVLAALCDGKTVTTAGYDIVADYSVNRASAVVHSLKKKLIPVSTKLVETRADVGGTTQQSIFYIAQDDITRLENEADVVFYECGKELLLKKESNAQKDIQRLCREFGVDGFLKLFNSVVSANDDNPPSHNVG